LRSFYRAKDRCEEEKILERVLIGCETSEDAEMVRWGRTLRRWRKYFLNYFDHRTTNAYTEGVHTKIRLLNRASYGLRNIEVYVKKMLLGFYRLLFSISTTLFNREPERRWKKP